MTFYTIVSPVLGKKYSTDLCLSYLNDKILKVFDSGLLTDMILIDHQNAFGFCDDTFNRFHSYLTHRAFLVIVENKY